MTISFAASQALAWLEAASDAALDALSFGVIVMDQDGIVTGYNKIEAQMSGLAPARVVGRHFFSAVAPCTNNFMVAQRFETESPLDATIDYVFTLRMAPTKVRLRMLKGPDARHMYLLVERG